MLGVRDENIKPMIRDEDMELEGYQGLPRMIDKARLANSGALKKLNIEYPSDEDKQLLKQLAVDANTFLQMAISTDGDEQLLFELKRTSANM